MRQRLQQGAAGSLTVTLTDSDGSPADAAGAVTVGVARGNGSVVVAAGTATVHPSGQTGVYTVALDAAQLASLDLLTATWTDVTSGRVVITEHEVVGGFFFSLKDARDSDSTLTDVSKYPDSVLREKRQVVEDEAEQICEVAFVPRYARVVLDGSGTDTIVLPQNRIRVVRSVRYYPVVGGTAYVDFTPAQIGALVLDDDGTLHRTDFAFFNEGRGNTVIEVEHGFDAPPSDVRDASLIRLRSRANTNKTGILDRATSYTAENGQTMQLAIASAFSTGIPEVDAAYERYSYRARGDEGVRPVSRPLVFANQRYSVFHQG